MVWARAVPIAQGDATQSPLLSRQALSPRGRRPQSSAFSDSRDGVVYRGFTIEGIRRGDLRFSVQHDDGGRFSSSSLKSDYNKAERGSISTILRDK